jgi:hypothetical protein
VDWPGNGLEDYPNSDPPVGNGDPAHWKSDRSVTNFIKVRVHNNGTVLGKDVVVRAFINQPMGMGDRGTFVPFPDSDPQDIPAKSFKDFQFVWTPEKAGHTCITCIRADILSHNSALSDLDPANNSAQENVDSFAPAAGSPYKPVEFTFTLKNDQSNSVQADLQPSGLVDGLDLELEQRYLKLAPGEKRTLKGRLYTDINKIPPDPAKRGGNYCFNIHAFKRTPDSVLPFGGVTFDVNPGYRANLSFLRIVREGLTNVIVLGKLKGPLPAFQSVDASLFASDRKSYNGTAITDASGIFSIPLPSLPPGPGSLMLYYFGPSMAATSAGPIKVKVPR